MTPEHPCEKKWRAKNKEHKRSYLKAWRTPEKVKAHHATAKVQLGSKCEFCGSTKDLEGHHPDYSLPEIVITCCKSCHTWLDNSGIGKRGIHDHEC